MVEHAAVNRVVAGSSPASGANFASRWRTTTASESRRQKMPKCVVKCVVNEMRADDPRTVLIESRYHPFTAR
jgi:hypothetical protein